MSDTLKQLRTVLEHLLELYVKMGEENTRLKDQVDELRSLVERQNKQPDLNYFDFQMRYRGSIEEIKKRQSIYLPYFIGKTNVLDLGCGRGEFTELLLENDVSVKGIDFDQGMVAFCRDRGLPVLFADMFAFLEEVPDESVGGIFLGQVVEHLCPVRFVELIKLCNNKLEPEAYLVAETPNPECIAVFTHSFYLDLTHTKPIHSLAASFTLESNNFRDVQVVYSSPMPAEYHLPADLEALGVDPKTASVLRQWERTLFGYQDYAVIGRKQDGAKGGS